MKTSELNEALHPDSGGVDAALAAEKETVIRKFGLLDPTDWDDECESELEKGVNLFNELVKIEVEYRAEYNKIVGTNMNLEGLRKKIADLGEQKSQITLDIKGAASGLDRSTRAAAVSRVAAINRELAEAKNLVRLHYNDQKEKARAETRAAELVRRYKVKRARQLSGLWWGNYNAVVKSFEQARRAASKAGNIVNPRVFDGTGRFVNQIQEGVPAQDLLSGKNSQVKVGIVPAEAWTHVSRGERRRLQRTHLRVTVWVREGVRRYVTWPMIMHRPIPNDCLVKEVVVTRRKVAGRWNWTAVFICTRARKHHEADIGAKKTAAVDIGWRLVPEGIRVATILRSDGASKFIHLPRDFIEGFAFADELREKLFNHRRKMLNFLKSLDLKDAPSSLAIHIEAATRSPATLASRSAHLLQAWRESSWRPEASEQLSSWRRDDRKLYLWEANHRKKLIGRRTNYYQIISRDIAQYASQILLNRLPIGELVKKNSREISQNYYPRAAGWYRTIAAPSDLVHWIVHQCAKARTQIRHIVSNGPAPCPSCGSLSRLSRGDVLHQVCADCNRSWDQDLATCEAMVRSNFGM
ncbi:hypothetical protein [Methylobacterium nigriterrae]|uniref:hypothetical protein n=1 Tax=Methylobacterium nigriterrae TaxID=3127512 RepID=UPI003013884E